MDYDSGPYTVTFPAGAVWVTFNISVMITDDDLLEGNENFMLIINSSSLLYGPCCSQCCVTSKATVTIVDNDGKICNYVRCLCTLQSGTHT